MARFSRAKVLGGGSAAALRGGRRRGLRCASRASAVLPGPFATVAGVPCATSCPPSGPPPGPKSMTQSAAAMTSRSCSTTRTLAPSSTRVCSASMTGRTSSACRPALGSSTTNSVALAGSLSARASLRRCASPPDSVDSGCPSGRYPSPTRCTGTSARRRAGSGLLGGSKHSSASSTVISSASATLTPQ